MTDVVLSDLPVASSADDADLTLLRKGLTDYQCAASLIRNINVAGLPSLPSPVSGTDLMIVARGGSNYKIPFNQVGFPKGTRMWFFQATAPSGWTLVSGLGDRLIACAGNSTPYAGVSGGGSGGTWQQEGVGGGSPGGGLSLTQIPNHNHFAQFGQDQSNSHATYIHGARNPQTGGDPKFGLSPTTDPVRGMVGGKGDNANHNVYGQCDPHNHGNTWRPKANVGIICSKDN